MICDATLVGRNNCSGDTFTVFHGKSTPAHACGYHALHSPRDVYAGHEIRTEASR